MTDNVIDFNDKGTTRYLKGPIKCLACEHEWTDASPIGIVHEIECPACGSFKGAMLRPVISENAVYHCACGGFLFAMADVGPMCYSCGAHVPWSTIIKDKPDI